MAKIFLTGPVRIGKSTVIRRVLENLPFSVGGIRTQRVDVDPGRRRFVLIDCITGAEFEFARRCPEGMDVDTEVFEKAGVEAIRRAMDGADLVLLDELGRMELGARKFQRAVFEALDSGKPVLGVIKPESNAFLDAVRSHPGVVVLQVSKENRDSLVDVVLGNLESPPGRDGRP
ncbi:MAG: DUF2478 domain-containing protein [Candidatus Eisenbacteria sp.]|nr:DUF2478 domain-containing protein [Candidatus Eisenbacteria bacterium]